MNYSKRAKNKGFYYCDEFLLAPHTYSTFYKIIYIVS